MLVASAAHPDPFEVTNVILKDLGRFVTLSLTP